MPTPKKYPNRRDQREKAEAARARTLPFSEWIELLGRELVRWFERQGDPHPGVSARNALGPRGRMVYEMHGRLTPRQAVKYVTRHLREE